MAGFKTHISVSTALGVAYGAGAWWNFDTSISQCVMAGGLCSLSGMLPDLDSDSGVPLRESIAFAAAVVPMFMIERFKRLGMDPESIVLAGGAVYLLVRFGLANLLKHFTVHRGMFHSIPAALIAGELAFLICARDSLWTRYFFGLAVIIGFMSHLVLDEIWSVEFRRGRFQLKKSFGTAVKFWSDDLWANFSTYAKLGILSLLVWQDPVWMDAHTPPTQNLHRIADDVLDDLWR